MLVTAAQARFEARRGGVAAPYPFAKLLEDVDFDKSLLVESFLVADDLHRNEDTGLVINTPDNLPEASLPEHINDLVSIGEMIARDDRIVSSLVVVTKVGQLRLTSPTTFAAFWVPQK